MRVRSSSNNCNVKTTNPAFSLPHGSFTSFSFFHFFALFSLPLHCIEIRQRMKGKKKEASRGKEKHNTKEHWLTDPMIDSVLGKESD